MTLRACVCVAIVAGLASDGLAQVKPIGAFEAGGAPGWVTFGALNAGASDAELQAAAERSRATGFQWVLQIGYGIPAEVEAGEVAAVARRRAELSGLWPYVIAVTYGEEWHERCLAGEFAYVGLTAGHPECGVQVVAWMSRQHQAVKAATGRPVVWITGVVHPTRAVPAFTDYVAVDYYPQDGQGFDAVAPVFLNAERYTDLPLVLIPRWFKTTGPKQGPHWQQASQDPRVEWMYQYAAILRRPRWVAMWGFLGADRPHADLVGLWSMPTVRAAVAQSLGVQ